MTDKLAKSAFYTPLTYNSNIWSPTEVDKLESLSESEYREVVKSCRFFYKHDPIVSTVFNKMVDIGITELKVEKSKLSPNEFKIINALRDELEEFAEAMALEYLITGLVVPEVKFAAARKDDLQEFGIKRYDTLIMPMEMWLRDPSTIKINSTIVTSDPSYFVQIPDELLYFVKNGGKYPDGTADPKLFAELKAYYPEFLTEVMAGQKYILLDNPWIIRRRPLSDSPYPVPYLMSALEPLRHKRNLRRMDYAIAARVISAIQLFKLGDKDFPITEDQTDAIESLKEQMYWRNSGNRDVERIFQLFSNHTLQIEWIYPPVDALLDEKKYTEVNEDIIVGMGFPKILMTGEVSRSGTSQPEYAMMSPLETIKNFRRKITKVLNNIVDEVINQNNLKGTTEVYFADINLHSYADFTNAMTKLYDSGNISRTSLADAFGYNLEEEMEQKKEDEKLMKDLGLEAFAPKPFSPQPKAPGTDQQPQDQKQPNPQNKQQQ